MPDVVLLTLGLALASVGPRGDAQAAVAEPPLRKLEFMIGRWQGTTDGAPGRGTVQREYSRALDGRFIRAVNRSEYLRS